MKPLLTPKQKMLSEALEQFCKFGIRPRSLEWDEKKEIDSDFFHQFIKLARSFGGGGLGQPPKAKGKGESHAQRTLALLAEQLAWGDAAVMLSMPGAGLGGPPVRATGTEEQKKRFLGIFEDMSKELKWGAYGLTEPHAGSDVAAISTRAEKVDGGYVLNGRKCYITNGGRASWTVIFATADQSLGRRGQRPFVVEKGTPGFSVGRIEDKLGLRANETAELVLQDCFVPTENLLGGEERYGSIEGFMTAMKTFDNTRPLVAAMALGIGRAAAEFCAQAVKDAGLLGQSTPLSARLQGQLGQMRRQLEHGWLLTWRACELADLQQPNAKEASMSKAAAGQAAIFACCKSLDLCGQVALDHPELPLLEKWYRDIKVFDIFEGTGQIQRVVISKRLIDGLRAF